MAKPIHVDDFIFKHRSKSDEEKYAKFVLNYFRMPATLLSDFYPWMKQFKLFCSYNGERYQVTGASRLGDVWLASDPEQKTGYEKRVNINECSEWSNKMIKDREK